MDFNKYEVKKTYLSKNHYAHGLEVSLFFILTIIVFSNIHWDNFFDIKFYLDASSKEVFLKKNYWKAWTTTLIHADMTHLLSNISMLLFWGFLSASYYGPFFYPIVSFFINGLLTIFVLSFYPTNTILLGSSGLIFFLGGHWVTLYIFIDKTIGLPKRLFKGFGVALILFFPSSFSPTTSYLAHYIGLLGGIIFGIFHYLYKRKKFKDYEEWTKCEFEEEDFQKSLEEYYSFDSDSESEDEDSNKKNYYH